MSDDPSSVAAARAAVLRRIEHACERAGRDASDVTLVAVSKGVPVARLTAAVEAGLDLLGENRVQEAEAKIPLVPGATWHLVGHLQGNKAARALELFSVIESLDSMQLARRLHRLVAERGGQAPLPVFLQVNVDGDPAKTGFDPDGLAAAIDEVASLSGLRLLGLMTVGRLVADPEDARPTFVALRELSRHVRDRQPALEPGLSMGMTDDFEVAVEEGATVVRVGRALFGERSPG